MQRMISNNHHSTWIYGRAKHAVPENDSKKSSRGTFGGKAVSPYLLGEPFCLYSVIKLRLSNCSLRLLAHFLGVHSALRFVSDCSGRDPMLASLQSSQMNSLASMDTRAVQEWDKDDETLHKMGDGSRCQRRESVWSTCAVHAVASLKVACYLFTSLALEPFMSACFAKLLL